MEPSVMTVLPGSTICAMKPRKVCRLISDRQRRRIWPMPWPCGCASTAMMSLRRVNRPMVPAVFTPSQPTSAASTRPVNRCGPVAPSLAAAYGGCSKPCDSCPVSPPPRLPPLPRGPSTDAARSPHRSPQLMEDAPSRAIAAQFQHPLQLHRAHAVRLAGKLPHRGKPGRQRQLGVLKYRPGQHGRLVPAMLAKPQAAFHRPGPLVATTRTAKGFRPAQAVKVFQTGGLIVKTLLQFQLSPGVIIVHVRNTTPCHRLGHVHILMATAL